jgi:hypothetical protein
MGVKTANRVGAKHTEKSSTYLVISHYNDSAGEKPLLFVRHFHIHNVKKLMVLMTVLALTKFSL